MARWVTENNRPPNIVTDRQLHDMLSSGRPQLTLPTKYTISRDIFCCFDYAREKIDRLLQEYDGRLHIATDAWTSPNHRAFVAFTVHLAHNGRRLQFLLDIFEVPEV